MYTSLNFISGYFFATILHTLANNPSLFLSTFALCTAVTFLLLLRNPAILNAYSAIRFEALSDVIRKATTVASSALNSQPKYTSSVFSLTIRRSIDFEEMLLILG